MFKVSAAGLIVVHQSRLVMYHDRWDVLTEKEDSHHAG